MAGSCASHREILTGSRAPPRRSSTYRQLRSWVAAGGSGPPGCPLSQARAPLAPMAGGGNGASLTDRVPQRGCAGAASVSPGGRQEDRDWSVAARSHMAHHRTIRVSLQDVALPVALPKLPPLAAPRLRALRLTQRFRRRLSEVRAHGAPPAAAPSQHVGSQGDHWSRSDRAPRPGSAPADRRCQPARCRHRASRSSPPSRQRRSAHTPRQHVRGLGSSVAPRPSAPNRRRRGSSQARAWRARRRAAAA